MTAKCIKADPLQWLMVGEEYECKEIGSNVIIEGAGMAVSKEQFAEMFKKRIKTNMNKQHHPPEEYRRAWRNLIIIIVVIALAMWLTSCKSVQYVPVPEYHNDTTYITKQQRDSIYLHDSISVKEKGDTVLIEKWRTKYVERMRIDTLFFHNVDSVAVPYPVPATLSRWQQFCCDYGKLMIGATAAMLLALIFVIVRRIRSPTL
jgi:hypothetical protein